MKRPLLFILSFLVIGILIANYIENIFIIGAMFLSIFFISLYFYKRYSLKLCSLLWIFSVIGFIIMNNNCKISNIETKILNAENIRVTGVIKSVKFVSNSNFSVTIKVDQIEIDEEIIEKNFYITSYMNYNENIKEGYGINFNAKFTLGAEPRNPNEFNEYIYLKSSGIDFKAYINDYEILELKDKFSYYLSNLNKKIGEIYDKILPEEEATILKAILLGDRDYLKDEIKELYRNVGIYHILAISGLHIGVLAVFLNWIFSKLSRKYGKLFVIIFLIIFCILTGGSLSTIRATFMCCIMLIGRMIYREYDILSAISLSAIILLIINPYNIFNTGFLFSYVSVFSIAFLGLAFVKKYNLKGITSSLAISFFVSLAIKPITAYYFYNFNTIDFLFNLIVIPFTSVIVCMGLLVTIVGMISIPLAEFLVGIIYYIFRFFTFMCKIIDNIDFFNIQIGRPSIMLIICFYTMLIMIGYYLYEKNSFRMRAKYVKIGLIILLIGLSTSILEKNLLKLTMLDVGQGDCIVGIAGSDTFIIDGGGGFSKNVGDNIILPYLESEGVTNVDLIFISHMDADHIDGILEIMGKIEIDNIFIAKVEHTANKYYTLIELAEENEINIYSLEQGDSLILGKNIYFEILHPSIEFNSNNENDNSLVINMEYKGTSVLFTGDIEKKAENAILEYLEQVDILKVAHHGSKSSTTEDFFEIVNPQVSLISCGVNNIYNHPSDETLQTLENTEIFRTDENGGITIKFYNNKYKITTVLK